MKKNIYNNIIKVEFFVFEVLNNLNSVLTIILKNSLELEVWSLNKKTNPRLLIPDSQLHTPFPYLCISRKENNERRKEPEFY